MDAKKKIEGIPDPNDWSNPLVREMTFVQRMLHNKMEVARWQGKFAIVKHENNQLRKLIAKPKAGEAYTKEELTTILREAISKTNDRGAVDVLTIINIAERNGIKF